jgi:PPOX class probable F420-dependent enzyme
MDVQTLAKSTYLSLTTFRRDGTPVATPVWLARQGDELMVFTASSSGKAKRLRNDGRVLLAPCDMRGRPTGDTVEGTARLQDDAETAVTLQLIRRRYGLQARLLFWWEGRHAGDGPGPAEVGIAIRVNGSGAA